jgi:hypothetical protein
MVTNIQVAGRMEHTPPEIGLAKGGLVMVKKRTPEAQGRRSDMGNEPRQLNDGNTNRSTAEGTKSMGNSRDSRPTNASERALNGAILAAEISESYEEYLKIFDHFYADDIHATADGLKEPLEGKAAVRARLMGFLVPLHVLARLAAFRFRFSGARSQAIDRPRRIARGRWSFAA